MRIFVLLSRVPWPLEKGDKLRAYHQIKQLSKNNEIILCGLNTNSKLDKQAAFHALQPFCRSINFIDLPKIGIAISLVKAFFTGKPFQCSYFYNPRAQKKINTLIQQYQPDILFGQLVRVAEYLKHQSTPKVLDYQDAFSMGIQRRLDIASWYQRAVLRMELNRLLRYEHNVFSYFDIKTIISEPDRNLIPHEQRKEILIVPNGVDHAYFAPQKTEKQYDVVFTGNMSYAPNVNAVEFIAYEILPKVMEKIPDVKFYIAGANPDPRVKKNACENIIVSGWLDDIRTAYCQSKVFMAPMRIGIGLQNKLLEAMSMGLPCITTALANGSLHAQNGKEILIGNRSDELAADIVYLLTNPEKAQQIAQAGNQFVHRVYDWEQTTKIMEDAMKKLLEKQNA